MELSMLFALVFIVVLFLQMIFFIRRYKRVSPDQLLVIYGRISADPNEKVLVHTSGATFVWPVIQDYFYLDASSQDFNISNSASSRDSQVKNYQLQLIAKLSSQGPIAKIAGELFFRKTPEQIKSMIEAKITEVLRLEIAEQTSLELKENYGGWSASVQRALKEGLWELGVELVALQRVELS